MDDDLDAMLAKIRNRQSPQQPTDLVALLAKVRQAKQPTGHKGTPFVNAPEMLQQHQGTPFVDATPEASPAQTFLGGLASVGRHTTDDLQTRARALLRERGGVSDVAKEIGRPTGAVPVAMRSTLPGLAWLAVRGQSHTPSYARAHEDIQRAEDSVDPESRRALTAIGDVAAIAPMVGPVAGASATTAKGAGQAAMTVYDIAKAMKGNPHAIARLAKGVGPLVRAMRAGEGAAAATEPVAGMSAPTPPPAPPSVPGLQGPMESAEEIGRRTTSDVAQAVKAARQSHRTQSQFRHFAEGRGADPSKQSTTAQLQELLNRLPKSEGNVFGDAEIAQGLDQPEPDLLDQLRRSIIAKGGVPKVP